MIWTHTAIPVTEPSQPSAARFAAQDAAANAGFDDTDRHRAGIVATELATNLVKHAACGGEILVRVTSVAQPEIEIISIDSGPGMRNVQECLEDGRSTAGSTGTGLGAVRRLSEEFDIFSEPGRGTIVLARLRARRAPPAAVDGFTFAAVSVALRGEPVCGDAWHVARDPHTLVAMVADGLGHGALAAEAAGAAIGAFNARPFDGAAATLETIHQGIRHTRGAAATIATVKKSSGVVSVAGVGNVAALIWTPTGARQVATQNGTLGHQVRQFREFTYPWSRDSVLVMYSDGLASHWSIEDYRGLHQRHPAIVAAVLYRDHRRQRDDVTVVVGREVA